MSELVTWFPQPRKYYFPGQNYHFPGQSIQDLKVINQYICERGYIYSMYDRLLTFLRYIPLLTPSSRPIHSFLFIF